MKKIIIASILLYCQVVCLGAQSSQIFKVYHSKFKHGMATEAMEIGFQIFLPAHQMNGINIQIYQYATGPWDIELIFPVDDQESLITLFSSGNPTVMQSMIDLAGGRDKLKEKIARYNELVITEQTDYMRLSSDPLQGTWYLTENNQEITTEANPLQKKLFQNGFFAFISRPQENHSWSMMGNYYTHENRLIETSTYTSNGKNTGVTVTWNYNMQDDGSLLVEGPISAVDQAGKDIRQKVFGDRNGRLVWRRSKTN